MAPRTQTQAAARQGNQQAGPPAQQQGGAMTAPAQTTEREISYKPFGESEFIKLTPGIVRKFLCTPTRSGKLPTDEDVVRFMMLCKARELNPWVNDAYLVGYDSHDGPKFSLITAQQALLKRAEVNPHYRGMQSGVIVMSKDGELDYREGDFVIQGEILIGGWAKVLRDDREVPSYDALNLATFNTNQSRWKVDPAGMIVKCSEASALRKAFPSQLGELYTREEMETVIDTTGSVRVEQPQTQNLTDIAASYAPAAQQEQPQPQGQQPERQPARESAPEPAREPERRQQPDDGVPEPPVDWQPGKPENVTKDHLLDLLSECTTAGEVDGVERLAKGADLTAAEMKEVFSNIDACRQTIAG